MRVDLCYVPGCPSIGRALENVHTALRAAGLPGEVRVHRVETAAEAVAHRLIGSPTVRIDGIDIEGPDADARGYGLGCRIYQAGDTTSGWPSVDAIGAALRRESIGGTLT